MNITSSLYIHKLANPSVLGQSRLTEKQNNLNDYYMKNYRRKNKMWN